MDPYRLTEKALMKELGKRLKTARLNQNITQDDLAAKAGVGKSVVRSAEAGGNPTLINLLRILRALQLLDQFDLLVPDTGVSPLQLIKTKGKPRARARQKVS